MEFDNEEKKGYTFSGWYIDPDYTMRLNPGGILPHELTLYDKWTLDEYPVTYELNGGENDVRNPLYVNYESGMIELFPAYREDRLFVCWTLNGKPTTVIPTGVYKPITLVAHYRLFPRVTFETRGGGIIEKKVVDHTLRLQPFRPPMKMGYDFENWYWDANYTNVYTFDQPIEHSCILFAKWKVKRFKITYDVDGGFSSRSNPKFYTYFDETIDLKPAHKKGYEFVGWYDSRGNELNSIMKYSLGHKHFVAHYKKIL